jgi:hypothetical protein
MDGMACKIHESDFNVVAVDFSMRLTKCSGWVGGVEPTALDAFVAEKAHYKQLHADNYVHLQSNKEHLVSSLAGLHDAIQGKDAKKSTETEHTDASSVNLIEDLANVGLIQALRQKELEQQQQQQRGQWQKKATQVITMLPPSLQKKIAPVLPKLVAFAGKMDTTKLQQNGVKLFTFFKQLPKQGQQADSGARALRGAAA